MPLLAPVGGCFLWGGDSPLFLESDDVKMEPVRTTSSRAAVEEYGDVYTLSLQTAHDVNAWIGEAIDGAGEVIDLLGRLPPSSTEGEWNVYGPHRDKQGRAWLVRLTGDGEGSTFETWVGSNQARDITDMDKLLWGSIEIDEHQRTGGFAVDFDVIERWSIKSGPNVDKHYTGVVEIGFVRDVDTGEKHVEVGYTDFVVTQEIPVPDWFSADNYAYHREADGSGTFHLSIASTFQVLLWSGPERETMTLDLVWDGEGRGRSRGRMQGYQDEGDLAHGDMVIRECFDDRGYLLWRDISDSYDIALPDYDLGDESDCDFDEAALPP